MVGFPPGPKSLDLDVEIALESAREFFMHVPLPHLYEVYE